MKKKTKTIAVLSTFAATLSLGIATMNAVPAYAYNSSPVSLLASTQNSSQAYARSVSDELIQQGEFDYGGLHYSVSGSIFNASPVENASSVKELILHTYLNDMPIYYSSSLAWENYSSVETLILTGNTVSRYAAVLSSITTCKNLYTGGSLDFGSTIPMTFQNVYINSFYYNPFTSSQTTSFTDYLATSNITNIYYNDFLEKYNLINTSKLSSSTNSSGTTIQVSKFESLPYPDELFYPFDSFDLRPGIFGTEGYYQTTSTSYNLNDMSRFTFNAISIDSRVVDISTTAIKNGYSLPYGNYGKVYLPNVTDYTFSNLSCDELMIKPSVDTLYLDTIKDCKAVRFLKSTTTIKVDSALNTSETLTKIYIPVQYMDKYTAITEREDLAPLVEYYDSSIFIAPYNSYLSEDGNVYEVSDSIYSIDEMEKSVEVLKAVGLDLPSNSVIDILMNKYEFPIIDYSASKALYTLRSFDTLVLPKNADATKVLEAFKMFIALNHNQMCDTEDVTITCDTSNYIPGFNAILPIEVTFPDGTMETKDVTIKVIPIEGETAYVLDKKNVYVITNPQEEETTLLNVMSPLMLNHFMESVTTYTESPILDLTTTGYNAANLYEASLYSGKAKVVVSELSLLTEGADTPPVDEPPVDDTPTEEENEGYIVKEIAKIYTPTAIDGTDLISQLRDELCTKDGKPYTVSMAIGTSSDRTNKEDYQFSIFATLGENYHYSKTVDVKIIPSSYKMGFVEFVDGTIAVLFHCDQDYEASQIEAGLKEFMTSINLNASSLSVPSGSYSNTKTYYGSYDKGKVIIVNSGSNIDFTTSTQPVDQSNVKKGYVALDFIYYTKGYSVEQVLRAFGKNLLLKDGIHVTDYKVSYETSEYSTYVKYVFTKGEEELLKGSLKLKEINSDYKYMFARAYSFDTGYLIMKKEQASPTYTLKDVMIDVVSQFRGLMSPFTTDATINFTKTGKADVDGVYQIGNGAYYSYEYDVEVLNLEQTIKANEVVIDGKAQMGETVTDKFQNALEEFKEKFKESNGFKAASIAIGSITGILLLYGLYVLIRKIIKWLRK